MPQDGGNLAATSAHTATRIGTGRSQFLLDLNGERIDGRTLLARRFRELTAAYASDLGGDLSEAENQLVRRAAALSVWAELAETKMAAQQFDDLDFDEFLSLCNVLRRLLVTLGLKRVARDATPTLSSYIEGRRVDAEAGDRSVQ